MKAPIVASWLLNRLIASSETDAIAGDLMEPWRGGRSRLWFWRQTLAAVAIWNWREVSARKMASTSGILTGMVSLWGFAALMTVALSSMGLVVHAEHWRWPHYVQLFFTALVYTTASGWIVGRLHAARRRTAVFAFFAFVTTALIWQLPLYYVLAPTIFFETILPHLPFFLIATLLGAPSILLGGLAPAAQHRPS